MLPIGQAAKRTGIKVPTIRYYEQEGLVTAPERSESGRRLYSEADIGRLAFIRHARDLGFDLADIRSLLDLSGDPNRSCADVNRIARRHLDEVDARISKLLALRRELSRIVRLCAGGRVGECRVIDALADHAACAGDHEPPAGRGKRRKSRRGR